MQRLLIAVALIATVTTTLLGLRLHDLHKENNRLENNCLALTEDVHLYRTRANESAASVRALELTIEEFRKRHNDDAERVKALGIRLRRVESYAQSVAEQHIEERVPLRDTIILRDTVRLFEGGDKWSRIAGIIAGDSLRYNILSIDTLHQVVHRVPR